MALFFRKLLPPLSHAPPPTPTPPHFSLRSSSFEGQMGPIYLCFSHLLLLNSYFWFLRFCFISKWCTFQILFLPSEDCQMKYRMPSIIRIWDQSFLISRSHPILWFLFAKPGNSASSPEHRRLLRLWRSASQPIKHVKAWGSSPACSIRTSGHMQHIFKVPKWFSYAVRVESYARVLESGSGFLLFYQHSQQSLLWWWGSRKGKQVSSYQPACCKLVILTVDHHSYSIWHRLAICSQGMAGVQLYQ